MKRYGEEVNAELVGFAKKVREWLEQADVQVNKNFEELARRVERR